MKGFFQVFSLILVIAGCCFVYFFLFFRDTSNEGQKNDINRSSKPSSENVRSLSEHYTALYDYEDGGFSCTLYRFTDEKPGDPYYIRHSDVTANFVSSVQLGELLYFIDTCPAIKTKKPVLEKQLRGSCAYFVPSSATKAMRR